MECRVRASEGAKALSSSSQHPPCEPGCEVTSDVDGGRKKRREYALRGLACQNKIRQSGSPDLFFDATRVPRPAKTPAPETRRPGRVTANRVSSCAERRGWSITGASEVPGQCIAA